MAVEGAIPLEVRALQGDNRAQKTHEVGQVHLRPEGLPKVMARSRPCRSQPQRRLGGALAESVAKILVAHIERRETTLLVYAFRSPGTDSQAEVVTPLGFFQLDSS